MSQRGWIIGVVVAVILLGGLLLIRQQTPSRGHGDLNISLTITGNSMSPAHPTARQGDTVHLHLTADRKEEIHLHGFDYKFEMIPGQSQDRTFVADRTGTFDIEIEDTSTALGNLVISP